MVGSQEDTEMGFCVGLNSPGIPPSLPSLQSSKKISVMYSKSDLAVIQNYISFSLCIRLLE